MLEKSQWPRTGLICIICREPVAYMEHTTRRYLTHNWIAEDVTSHALDDPLDIQRSTD